MSRVLVTGGAGFIGSHLVDALVERKHRVTVVDNLVTGSRKNVNPKARLAVVDIRSASLHRLVNQIKPQYIFHLAAQMNVRASIDDPVYDAEVNIVGSLNVIRAALAVKARRLIFSSTGGAIYGEQKSMPISESAALHPEAPYGVAKLSVEHYLRFFHEVEGLSSVCLRFANVYGPRQNPKGEAGVVAIFSERLLKKQPLIIFGNGRQTRDYIYVTDVVRANLAAMISRTTEPINVGTGKETSVNELIRLLMSISRIQTPVIHRPAVPGELLRNALRPTRAAKVLAWRPQIQLAEGLRKTVTSFGLSYVK